MQPRVDEKFRNVNDGTDDDGPAGGGKKKGVDCVSGQDYHGRKFLYEPGSDTSPMQGSITNFSCASLPLGETLGLRVIVYWQFLDLLLQIECKKTRKIRVSHVGRRDYRNEITTKKNHSTKCPQSFSHPGTNWPQTVLIFYNHSRTSQP
jgi:hypothetical protein